MSVADDEHLVLVGMMGSGKSTVGRVVAERLGRPMFDSDSMIEARTGRTVRQIFADDGEPAFRDLEAEVLAEALASPEPAVIAAAGGVVLREGNRRALHDAAAKVIWLRADPALLARRVRSGAHRPLLDESPESVLATMHREREPLYLEVADQIVAVDGRSVCDVADAVLR